MLNDNSRVLQPVAFRGACLQRLKSSLSPRDSDNGRTQRPATACRLKPLAAVAKLIKRHLPNLLTYPRHRLTKASLAGVNAVHQ